jgi:hypothetical protein
MNLLFFDSSVQGREDFSFELKASVVDRCTGKPTSITPPNGTAVRIEFPKIDASEAVTLELQWRLAGISGDFSEQNRIIKSAEVSGSDALTHRPFFYSLPSSREFEAVEKRAGGSHVWNLTVLATQGFRIQGASAYLLRVGPRFDYFSVRGTPLCRWSTTPRVSSAYRYNPGPDPLVITRRISTVSETGFGKDFFPPVFRGRGRESLLTERFDFDRGWKLAPRQGGLFADREAVTRMQAEHFEWRANPEGCGTYVRTETGTLDLPETSSEFFTIPQTLIGDEAGLRQFLDTVSPPISTCDPSPNLQRDFSDTEFEFIPDHS